MPNTSKHEELLRKFSAFLEEHSDELTEDGDLQSLVEQFDAQYHVLSGSSPIRTGSGRKTARTSERASVSANRPAEHAADRPKDRSGSKAKSGSGRKPSRPPRRSAEGLTAEDYIKKAQQTDDHYESLEYAQKALKLEPYNCEALMIQSLFDSDGPEESVTNFYNAIDMVNEKLEHDGVLPDGIGRFRSMPEVRDYLILLRAFVELLYQLCRYQETIDQCEEMLRLDPRDNTNVHNILMFCYCLLDDEENAMRLYVRYRNYELRPEKKNKPIEDDPSPAFTGNPRKELRHDSNMVLALAAMYYWMDDMEKAGYCLTVLRLSNRYTEKFLELIQDLPEELDYDATENPEAARGTLSEFTSQYDQSRVLFDNAPDFPEWALNELRKQK